MNASPPLALRALPKQERAVQTMDLILKVAAEILASNGFDSFNTNLVAQKAGLSPRAIYRYFPNKWAILHALRDRYRRHEDEWIGDLTRFATTEDWSALVDESIWHYYRSARRETGFAALRAATYANPELGIDDEEENAAIERQLAVGLAGLGVALREDRLLSLCRVIIESINRIVDISLTSPDEEADRMLEDLCTMIRGLIAHHIEGKAT